MKRVRISMAALVAICILAVTGVVAAGGKLFEGLPALDVTLNGKSIVGTVPGVQVGKYYMVPVDAMAAALGGTVTWDGVKQSVDIALPTSSDSNSARLSAENEALKAEVASLKAKLQASSQPSVPVASGAVGKGRTSPAPVGTPVQINYKDYSNEYTARVTIEEIQRGAPAWARVKAANMFNDPAPTGYEYVLVKIKFELLTMKDPDASLGVDYLDFDAISSSGREYESKSVVEPEPSFDTHLYAGASFEGWAVYTVATDDKAPLLAYGRDYAGKGGIWFSLTEAASGQPSTDNTKEGSQAETQVPREVSSIKTVDQLVSYLNRNYNQVKTPTGTLTLNYSILTNDRSFLVWDYWLQMRYEPSLFFTDLKTKLSVTKEDRDKTAEILRAHSKSVYDIVHTVFPSKKVSGSFYDSWYRYPTLQVDLITRTFFSWENYNWNPLGPGSAYENAKLSEFHWTPEYDDYTF